MSDSPVDPQTSKQSVQFDSPITNDKDMNELWIGKIAYYYLTTNLKNYRTYKQSKDLYGRVFSCCDACYSVYPKASLSESRPDWKNKNIDETFCSSCFDKLDFDLKSLFEKVSYSRSSGSALF
jgi:hypothetical protein